MITTGTTTTFTCSDGQTFTDQRVAELHEAELKLKAVCDEHGYSAPSFSREFLYDFLLEHVAAFAPALAAVMAARAPAPTTRWRITGRATGTDYGTFAAAHQFDALEALAQELHTTQGADLEWARATVAEGHYAIQHVRGG